MSIAYSAIINVLNLMLYSFWFALLVFVIFIGFMTYVTIKTKEKNEKVLTKKKEYQRYCKLLLYSVLLIAVIMTSLYMVII